MFFEVCKHDFSCLTTQAVDRFGFLSLHPSLMGNDDIFVLAAPTTPAAFLARRAWRPQRARVAGRALSSIAHHTFLTPSTTPTRFASHPLEHMPRRATRGLQVGQP